MIAFYLSGNPTHDRVIQAFYEGCPEEKKLIDGFQYEPSDIAVVFGVYKSKVVVSWPRGQIFRQQRQNNKDVIVLETGYINRGDGEHHHYAAGFNGLNGRADFKNKGMPNDRVRKLGIELKPWRKGSNLILCGQVPWDASVDHSNHFQWLQQTAEELKKTGLPVVFRPHPLAKLAPLPGIEYSTVPLKQDLQNAHCVVTFNSNAGVEALLEGVPVYAADEGSMAWPVALKSLSSIAHPLTAIDDGSILEPDRVQWLNNLSYCQWTLKEMANGEAWTHLFR